MSPVPMLTGGDVFAIVAVAVAALFGLAAFALNAFTYDTFSRDKNKRLQGRARQARDKQRATQQKKDSRAAEQQAKIDAQKQIVCQFCHQKGHVTARLVQRKQGVSGGKATAGLLTGGVSLFAVGLSKKGWVTNLKCSNCNMQWDVVG